MMTFVMECPASLHKKRGKQTAIVGALSHEPDELSITTRTCWAGHDGHTSQEGQDDHSAAEDQDEGHGKVWYNGEV